MGGVVNYHYQIRGGFDAVDHNGKFTEDSYDRSLESVLREGIPFGMQFGNEYGNDGEILTQRHLDLILEIVASPNRNITWLSISSSLVDDKYLAKLSIAVCSSRIADLSINSASVSDEGALCLIRSLAERPEATLVTLFCQERSELTNCLIERVNRICQENGSKPVFKGETGCTQYHREAALKGRDDPSSKEIQKILGKWKDKVRIDQASELSSGNRR